MRAVAAFLLVACSLACGANPSSLHRQTQGDVHKLYSRSLSLPTLAAGASCPISPEQVVGSGQLSKRNEPFQGAGSWPVFLTGQDQWFAGEAAELEISPEYLGPLVVRGRQLDGQSGLPLEPAGTQGIEIAATTDSSAWRQWSGRVPANAPPGCYGLQADGFNFTSQIVFAIQPGPAPPA